jgi:hypothetical protein
MVVNASPAQGYLVQSLRAAADSLEQRLTLSSGLTPGNVTRAIVKTCGWGGSRDLLLRL